MSTSFSFFNQARTAVSTISWARIEVATLWMICIIQFLAILFFPDGLPLKINIGSLADWTSALGTVLVGLMAWRISRRSHEYNELVQRGIAIRTTRREQALLRSIQFQADSMIAGNSVVIGMNPKYSCRGVLVSAMETYGALEIDRDQILEALPLLDLGESAIIDDLQTHQFVCAVHRNRMLNALKGTNADEPVSNGEQQIFDELIQKLRHLNAIARKFSNLLVMKHVTLKDQDAHI